MVRALFRGLRSALSAVQLLSDLKSAEVKNLYVGPEEGGEMYEVLVELSASSEILEEFLRSVSSVDGFVDAVAESLVADILWEGLR
ncbi:MAG: hypothetical protein NZ938_02680 [Aigarchaeota archaeon]|nr:hypothetical protein [Candidatus Calditenuaceae archaeon]